MNLASIPIDPATSKKWLDFTPISVEEAKATPQLWAAASKAMAKNLPSDQIPALALSLGKKTGELLRERGRQMTILDPNQELDDIASTFVDPNDRESFYREFRKNYFKVSTPLTACEAACAIAGKFRERILGGATALIPKDWYGEVREGEQKLSPVDESWHYALTALNAAFLSKAQPYCHSLKEPISILGEALSEEQEKPSAPRPASSTKSANARTLSELINSPDSHLSKKVIRQMTEMASLAEEERGYKDLPSSPLVAFGAIFHTLFLNQSTAPGQAERNQVKASFERSFDRFETLSRLDAAAGRTRLGSRFFSYLLASGAIAAVNQASPAADAILSEFRRERTDAGPCGFGYWIGSHAKTENERVESALRSVTINFGLYLDRGSSAAPKDKKAQEIDRIALLEALGCSDRDGWRAALQNISPSFHAGSYSYLGSHFFTPNAPYIASAIKALQADPNTTPEEQNLLAGYSERFQQILLSKLQPDNQFEPMGSGTRAEQSRGYVNQLGALALLQFCARPGELVAGLFPREESQRFRPTTQGQAVVSRSRTTTERSLKTEKTH